MTKSPESRASRTFKSISMWGILGFICSGILVYNQDGLSSWFTENEISHLGRMPAVDDEGVPLVVRAYLPNWEEGRVLRLSAAVVIDMASVASNSRVSTQESPVGGERMPVLRLGTSYHDVGGQPIDAIESSSTCQPLTKDCLPKSVSIPPPDVDAIVARCFAINPDARSTLNETTLNNFRTYFGVDLSFKLNSTPTNAISQLEGMKCHASLGGDKIMSSPDSEVGAMVDRLLDLTENLKDISSGIYAILAEAHQARGRQSGWLGRLVVGASFLTGFLCTGDSTRVIGTVLEGGPAVLSDSARYPADYGDESRGDLAAKLDTLKYLQLACVQLDSGDSPPVCVQFDFRDKTASYYSLDGASAEEVALRVAGSPDGCSEFRSQVYKSVGPDIGDPLELDTVPFMPADGGTLLPSSETGQSVGGNC